MPTGSQFIARNEPHTTIDNGLSSQTNGSVDSNVPDIGTTTPDVNPTDLSDFDPRYQLPIRAEKQLIPTQVSVSALGATLQDHLPLPHPSNHVPSIADFSISGAKKAFTDYVLVRIPHRGFGAPDQPAVFRFLVNPSQVSVQRQTIDGQSLSRNGWQFGLWGEDTVSLSISGSTPNQLWAYGTTDDLRIYSISYRNLKQLETFFENNGYWYEGEAAGTGLLAASYTRKRIKMHQDVELTIGNFVWSGMFEDMSIKQEANTPFLSRFEMRFIAWREDYLKTSPYRSPMVPGPQRGHAYDAYLPYQPSAPTKTTAPKPIPAQIQAPPLPFPLTPPALLPPSNGSSQTDLLDTIEEGFASQGS